MTIIRKMKKSDFFNGHSLFAGLCSVFALFFVFAFASCETGLGESIDTSVPTVTITQPASSSSISGDLVISGVANDDKSLSNVVLTIKNTATNQVTTQVAPITGTNWQVVLSKVNFRDGTYSVDVVAYDAAGRVSGTANRVFDVDNTPPVFCVTKPNSLKISDPAPFGRDVTIKGEIADDHAVKQMDIRVFKSDGTEITGSLAKTSFTGFETAGGTEITIAKYFLSEPDKNSDDYPLYLNYKAMYDDLGASFNDTMTFYIFPYLTDAAGNVSDKCYIQSSLKQLLSKACGVETTSDSLQTAQLKKILNGSYNLGEVNVDTVKAVLNGTYDQNANIGVLGKVYDYYSSLGRAAAQTAGKPLAMSLNANNSPTYEFGGYSIDIDDINFQEVGNGGNISIKVTAGLDGNEIIANTVRVCLWECNDYLKPKDEDGFKANDPERASYYSGSATASKKFSVTSNGTELADLPDTEKVSTATYSIALPSTLSSGIHYILTATGIDVANNSLSSTATYAFKVATTGDAPKVEFAEHFFINAKAIDKNKKDDSPYIAKMEIVDRTGSTTPGTPGTGTIRENGNWVKVKPYLYKGYAKTKGYLSDLLDGSLPIVEYKGEDIKYKNGSSADGEYYIEVPMNIFDLTGSKAAANYTVALEVTAKNTGATSETTTYIFWADNKAPDLEITSPAGGSIIFENDKNITDTTPQGASAKTYEYTPRGAWKDESGSGTCELWYAWDTPADPVIAWTEVTDATAVATAGVTYYTKQGGGAGDKGIYLADTAIVTGTTPVVGKYTLSVGSDWTPITDAPKSASRANWNQSLPVSNSSGRKLNFVAVDQTGNISAVAKAENLTFDFAPPAIDLSSVDLTKKYYKAADKTADGDYKFPIDIEDASGIKSLVVTAKKAGAPVASGSNGYTLTVTDLSTTKKRALIKLLPTTSDGLWNFEITATDKTNRVSKADFSFTVDNVSPERVYHYKDASDSSKNRMITIGDEGSVNAWHNSESLTLSGKFKETASGLDKVVYSVASGEEQTEVISGTVGEAIAFKISPIGFVEGTNQINIHAVDLAGNSSTTEGYDIKIDITAPLVNTAWYTYDESDLNEAAGTVMSNCDLDMIVYGTLEEALSGIKSVDLKIGASSVLKSVQYTDASGLNQGADAAAKKATFTGAAWADYSDAYDADKGKNKNQMYTGFKAVVDKDKLSKIEVEENGVTTKKKLSEVDSADVELVVVATDMAGNKTEQRKFVIHLDKRGPDIKIASPEANAVLNGKNTFTGSVDDSSLSKVQAYWSWNEDSGLDHEITSIDGTYSWNIKNLALSSVDSANDQITFIDGTEYSGSVKDVYLKIKASDKAGNQSVKVQKYTIDPDKDRPKITLTAANLDGMTATKFVPYDSQKIEMTVEDDDGVKKVEWSALKDGESAWTAFADATFMNGAWSFAVPKDDKYTIKFRVTDNSDTVFESTKSDEKNIYLSPIVAGKDKTFSTGDTYIYLQVDTKRPELEILDYSASSTADGTYESVDGGLSKGVVGGLKKYIRLDFNASDDNGITAVQLTLNGNVYPGTVGAKDANGKYPCYITGVPVGALVSDKPFTVELKITGSFATDVTTEKKEIIIDNIPPEVRVQEPDSVNSVHGKVTVWGSVEGTNSMQYAITYTDYNDDATIRHDGTKKPAEFGAAYKDINGVGNNWFVYFDSAVTTAEESHEKTFEQYILEKTVKVNGVVTDGLRGKCPDNVVRLPDADGDDSVDANFDAIIPFYIWIKAVDDVGNVYEESHLINFDPQGGRPIVTFDTPEEDDMTVGGEVKLNGGAECDEGDIDVVFLQIISKQHRKIGDVDYSTDDWTWGTLTPFTPSANDLDYLKAAGYTVVKMSACPTDPNAADYATKLADAEWKGSLVGSEKAEEYGVLANFKGGSWDLKINGSGEFDPVNGTTATNQVIVRAYAYHGSKHNLDVYRQMKFDADSPIIEKMYLKRYDSGAVTASKAYKKGVFVKGACHLEFDLRDVQGTIAKVYLGQSDEDDKKAKEDAEAKEKAGVAFATPLTKTYHAKISLDTGDGVGSKYLYVKFYDEKGHGNYQAFTVNYDNVKPVISDTEPTATNPGINSDVHNSDGFYTLKAKVTENAVSGKNQSGFERFVFYFKRGNKIYDPMISKKNAYNFIDISGLTTADDGLYWLEKTVTRPDETHLVFTGSTNAHIHGGRLVKIGGTIYKIKSVSVSGSGTSATTTVTLNDNVETSETTAYFVYGDSIDNIKESKNGEDLNPTDAGYGAGYPTSITSDDGDGMVEEVLESGTSRDPKAYINSRNIPDGAIEIYWTAFDAAGNFATGHKSAMVSNNAPRLAAVTVASDWDCDGSYSAAETLKPYNPGVNPESKKLKTPTAWDKAWSQLTLGSDTLAYVAAKSTVQLKPEILGGNGKLKWTCAYPGYTTSAEAVYTNTLADERAAREQNLIELPEASLKLSSSGNKKYVIKILDETEGGAQEATINLWMQNDVNDAKNPVAKTKRFFWKSLTNNSVYGSGSTKSQADLKGHIELEGEAWTDENDVAHAAYANPQVSGKIVIKGTAFDNAGIKSINLTIPGILNTATTVATCDFTKAVASRWTQTGGSLADDGYHFALDTDPDDNDKIKERYTNTGHFVSWTLELDTEKAKFGTNNLPAQTGVNFVLGIVDKNSKTSSATTNTAMTVYATKEQHAAGKYYAEERFAKADAESEDFADADYTADEFKTIVAPATIVDGVNEFTATPVNANYTMDIVPYITRAETSLSAVNSTNGVTDRSSLGHYPIYVYKNSTATATDVSAKTPDKTETVTIRGFNLRGSKYGSGSDCVTPATYKGYVTLDSDKITSGPFALTVNGIGTLNNSNNNNAKGSYTTTTAIADGGTFSVYKNYINRQPNDANNNNLTDDIAFDIWQLNSKAAIPMSGGVDDPQMRISPVSTAVDSNGTTITVGGKIGFAFSNGSNAFSMPNDTYSWSYWAYDYVGARHTALAYDPDGKVWAAAAGQDTSENGGDSFFLESSRWRQHGGGNIYGSTATSGTNVNHDMTKLAICKLERLAVGTKNSAWVSQNRVQSPSIAATTKGLYMAYYDGYNRTIRYRAGDYSQGFETWNPESDVWSSGSPDKIPVIKFKSGFFADEATAHSYASYSEDNVQIVAGVSSLTDPGRGNAAPNVCIAAKDGGATRSDDVVVMVWHDGNKVMYSYTTSDPMAINNSKLSAVWSEPKAIFGSDVVGKDCQCAVTVDAKGGVHIAAYDSNDMDLWYAYLPSPSDLTNKKIACVDSYESTGVSITIDVALDASNNPLPQIGFYSASSLCPKFARWNTKKGSIKTCNDINGTDSKDSYTGNWEVTNVPTTSDVRTTDSINKVKQNINVGVWKNASNGQLAASTTGSSYCVASNPGINATNYGDVYGNGSKNAVLGYMWGSDSAAFIETAQRVGDYDD